MNLTCNILWFLSGLGDSVAFVVAAGFPRAAQTRVLRRILRRNAGTAFGRRHAFSTIASPADYAARVPISEYADYAAAIDGIARGEADPHHAFVADRIRILEPTSGTGSRPKLIPYTDASHREFLAAIRPWLTGLYLRCPSLFVGRQYWSLSPNTRAAPTGNDGTRVKVGFEADTEYLGGLARRVANRIMAVPPELSRITDPGAFEYLTLLFLLREANLRLISVWHPSFLTILLDALPGHWQGLIHDIHAGGFDAGLSVPPELRATITAYLRPAPRRANQLVGIGTAATLEPARIWPRLRVISCWTRHGEPWLTRLRAAFPRAVIQAKGLVATEGIVTLPLGDGTRQPAAVRSHYLEFLDRTSNRVKRLWELASGEEYVVLLTTGGGLYRYCLHDRVTVAGRFMCTPCLRFLGREGGVSDLVGEKLDLRLAEDAVAETEARSCITFAFVMLAPDRDADGRCGYICYAGLAQEQTPPWPALADAMDTALRRGYHYDHARRLGQLQPLRMFELTGSPAAEYRTQLEARGMKRGDIKLPRLSPEAGWDAVFRGRFVAEATAIGPAGAPQSPMTPPSPTPPEEHRRS